MVFGKSGTDREERIDYRRMREYRLGRAREQMEKAGLGCLITWDAWNIRYLTGVYITVPTRWMESQCVVLPTNGDPVVYGGGSGSPYRMRKEMPWLKEKLFPSGVIAARMRMARTKEDVQNLVSEVVRIMDEHGVRHLPLGVDGSTSELLLQAAFKDVGIEVVDAKHVMSEARKIKNVDEVECIKIACANAEAAFADIMAAIRPGVTECELVGIGAKTLYALGSDENQEFVCVSGENTNPFRVDFTDRQIRPGDLVIIDINGNSFQGYKSCYYRTFCCGKASAEQRELYEECRAMMYDGISAVRAGNTTLDICERWPKSPRYWGYETWPEVATLAMGHGVGITLHDYPIFTVPSARANPITLEENMVLALETWVGRRGGKDAVRLEEMVLVTKDGYELLTKFPVAEIIECWT